MRVPGVLRAEGATSNDWSFDAALAGVGLALAQFPYLIMAVRLVWKDPTEPNYIAAAVCGSIAFAAVAVRRHFPPLFFLIVYAMLSIQVIFCEYPTISWLLLPLALFDMARWMKNILPQAALVMSIIMMVLECWRWFYEPYKIAIAQGDTTNTITLVILVLVTSLGLVVTPYTLGRRGYDVAEARIQQRAAEEDATISLLAEHIAHQKTAESRIRTEIARELHDIVAHSIAVMIVQAEGGLSLSRKSLEKAQQALSTIADTGRESLAEMRRIVYMLRTDSAPEAEQAAAPRLSAVPALVEKANAQLTVLGTSHSTTPSLESTIYRVIQEGLTNALKHAGANSDPSVVVKWQSNNVQVTVTNRATGTAPISDHRGSGLIGMTERVQAHNGILTIGPTETGDFEVCAQFPLQS